MVGVAQSGDIQRRVAADGVGTASNAHGVERAATTASPRVAQDGNSVLKLGATSGPMPAREEAIFLATAYTADDFAEGANKKINRGVDPFYLPVIGRGTGASPASPRGKTPMRE